MLPAQLSKNSAAVFVGRVQGMLKSGPGSEAGFRQLATAQARRES